jgi:arylsulfatase
MVMHWPAGISARGEIRTTPGHVIDVVPTVLEVAGAEVSKNGNNAPELPGKSLARLFSGDTQLDRPYLWWLHEGNRALRQGDWKVVAAKDRPWELYDLSKDRCETKDVAAEHPARVKELVRLWETERDRQFADAKVGAQPAQGKKSNKKAVAP